MAGGKEIKKTELYWQELPKSVKTQYSFFKGACKGKGRGAAMECFLLLSACCIRYCVRKQIHHGFAEIIILEILQTPLMIGTPL
jgi:hypothetical protein